ncbi:uncharacterized protein O3C94_015649 [Discoglossus pictus]
MAKEKKKSERILTHALEIISLLTGKTSLFQRLAKALIMSDLKRDKNILLNHALEIIYLLTGEEYTIVKRNSPHSHHLAGECKDAAVSLSMEVWDQAEENKKGPNTLGIPSCDSPCLQDENGSLSEGGENSLDEKDILQVTIHSELCAGTSNVKSSSRSRYQHDKEPDIRMKEEEIPDNIGDDKETDVKHYLQVKEEQSPVNIGDGHQDENLHTVSINEEGQYESEENNIQPEEFQSVSAQTAFL